MSKLVKIQNLISGVSGEAVLFGRWWFLLLWALGGVHLNAQEALRVSLAGDTAAAERKQAQNTVGYYNLLWGPVAMRCGAGESTEFNDNVRNTANAKSDVIFRPTANANLNWPVTEWNTLNFSVDAGYSFYAQHSDLNQLYLNPGSGISFDVYIKDWVINLHDRATVTENTYENPTTVGGVNNEFLQNDAGISGLWDLDKAVLDVSYDHVDYVNLTSSAYQPDSASENFLIEGGFKLRPEVLMGLEAGMGLINYSQSASTNNLNSGISDASQWNLGAFSSVQVSEHLSTRLDAGYTVYTPNSTRTNSVGEMTTMYFQFSLSHQISEHIDYSISAGHSVDFSYNGQPYDRYFVRLNPDWNFVRGFQISTPVWWEQGAQLAVRAYTYDQYGAGFSVCRLLTQKLSSSVYYRWVKQTSNSAGINYTDNIVGLNFNYRF